MAKQQTSLQYIYKINSSRLKRNKWNLKLSIDEARKNNELIPLADSQALRFVRDITNTKFSEDEVQKIKSEIKRLKRLPTCIEGRRKIRELYRMLDSILFVKDYIFVVMANNKDYDRANKGFFINGIKYKRLLATTGGAKNSTIIYVSESIYPELNKRIENGRDVTKPLVPGKLEAYKALTCSASIPVSNPKGILVVKDCETKFKSDVIKLDDTVSEYPVMIHEKDCSITLTDSDGYGLISPTLSEQWGKELKEEYIPSGFCIRHSYTKGMLFTFNFIDFAKNVAKTEQVQDVWGNWHNINDIEVILTTSMLKLWDSYTSIEHYLQQCEENGYTFSITKITPQELENERYLNYQFIQSLHLNDESIEKLIAPTIKEIQDVLGGDYRKSLLFLRGIHLNEDNIDSTEYDFVKALMIDKRMVDDPFVRNKIHNMIRKRINEAKVGVLKIRGNFSIISGDPYSLCQSIFGIEVTGLLKQGEIYSRYWEDRHVNKIACFRAPMTCHNNIRTPIVKDTKEMQYWYKYMNTCIILNSWDTITHAENGADKDSDSFLTTNEEVILNAIEELPAIMCVQKVAKREIVTEEHLIQANKNSFGDEIGSITNRITSMFSVIAKFSKDSPEYKELEYRITCGQNFQQNAIDKTKGIISKPMPKEWYDFKVNEIHKEDDTAIINRKRFNLSILADKKPYFFNYIYPIQMKKYKTFIDKANKNCLMRFGLSVEELKVKKDRTEEEERFLTYYNIKMPVEIYPSTMNKICWRIEQEFDDYSNKKVRTTNFDSSLLTDGEEYSKSRYAAIKQLYEEYQRELKQYSQTIKNTRIDADEKRIAREIFKQDFKRKALEICNNEEELCNIVIDLCYRNNSSKQFAWDISGKTIIKNLLKKNSNIIHYPTLNKDGEIEFGGYRFSMQEKVIESEVE